MDNVIQLKAIKKGSITDTIKVCIDYKGELREWEKNGKTGKVLSLQMSDDSGTIRAVAFDEAAEQIASCIKAGHSYYMSKFKAVNADFEFNNTDCDVEIKFFKRTHILPLGIL